MLFEEYGSGEYDYYDDIGNDNYENTKAVNDPRYYIDGKEYVKYGQPVPQRWDGTWFPVFYFVTNDPLPPLFL